MVIIFSIGGTIIKILVSCTLFLPLGTYLSFYLLWGYLFIIKPGF